MINFLLQCSNRTFWGVALGNFTGPVFLGIMVAIACIRIRNLLVINSQSRDISRINCIDGFNIIMVSIHSRKSTYVDHEGALSSSSVSLARSCSIS